MNLVLVFLWLEALVYSSLEDDIVYVRVHGACVGCISLDITLKDGVEKLILDEVPEIKEVRLA